MNIYNYFFRYFSSTPQFNTKINYKTFKLTIHLVIYNVVQSLGTYHTFENLTVRNFGPVMLVYIHSNKIPFISRFCTFFFYLDSQQRIHVYMLKYNLHGLMTILTSNPTNVGSNGPNCCSRTRPIAICPEHTRKPLMETFPRLPKANGSASLLDQFRPSPGSGFLSVPARSTERRRCRRLHRGTLIKTVIIN